MNAPRLSIVIPALNEEEAIGSTVERCLAARSHICDSGGVSEVEVVVVNDGSSDDTEEIAKRFPSVSVLGFDENQGYGAAIKTGFEHGTGDLVGFLDADGTCDPLIFGDLCRALQDENADLALGSRMGKGSSMPPVRKIGNTFFALLLGVLSKRRVNDTASGMRVIRRASLTKLYPLPDGLHFTPAMSARALMEDDVRLVEIPMPYAERIGQSKLSVVRDGWRFLRVIQQAAMCLRPARLALLAAGVFASIGLLAGAQPVFHYIQNRSLEEWMIYRVLLSSLLLTGVMVCLSTAAVAENIAATTYGRGVAGAGITSRVLSLFSHSGRYGFLLVLVGLALFVIWPGVREYAATGPVTMHWSRAVLASLLLVASIVVLATGFLLNMMELIRDRRNEGQGSRAPDRIRRGHGEDGQKVLAS